MPRQAIEQAECEPCGENTELTLLDKTHHMDDEKTITYRVRCKECRNESAVSISMEGTDAADGLTHKNATWNEESDDD